MTPTSTKSRGPKPKPPQDKKRNAVTVRFDDDELDLVRRQAAAEGMTPAQWLRARAMPFAPEK